MSDSIDYARVNEALLQYDAPGWSSVMAKKLEEACGPEVFAKVKEVYDDAMNCPVDWYKENMNSALGILADYLPKRFPWLSPEAKTHLNYCYIMTWK